MASLMKPNSIKIPSHLVDYSIEEIHPNIFALPIKSDYQRAMLFLRSQEYYESGFEEIKGKDFDIFEFMEIYRGKKDNDVFLYPIEWMGFNVPGHIIETCIKSVFRQNSQILPTVYDYIMESIMNQIKARIGDNKRWYLIGVDQLEGNIMEHEVSHGLYYTDPDYKRVVDEMISEIPERITIALKVILIEMGYCEEVLDDEIQAYLSTQTTKEMGKIWGIKRIQKKFRRNLLARITKKA